MSIKFIDSVKLDNSLVATASAIREKTGSSDEISFDYNGETGFATAVSAIPSGGTGDYVASDWLDSTKPTGELSSNTAFNSTSAPLLKGRTGITRVNLPEATYIAANFFENCTKLTSVYLPKATAIGASGMRGCTSLRYLVLPVGYIGSSLNVSNCSNLLAIDMLGGITNSNCCSNSIKMNILVLRRSTVGELNSINALMGTPFASGKAGGTLYVPNDLISAYQSASNWSTILAYPNNQIKSIESTHTDPNAPIDLTLYYIDGTPIPQPN